MSVKGRRPVSGNKSSGERKETDNNVVLPTRGPIVLDCKDANNVKDIPDTPDAPAESEQLHEEYVTHKSTNTIPTESINTELSEKEKLVLRRRKQQQMFMSQRGIGNRRERKKYKEQKRREMKDAKIKRHNDLLRHIVTKRVGSGKSSPPKNVKDKLYPKGHVKSTLINRETVERTRKTANISSAIFGSDIYIKEIYLFFLQKYGYNELPLEFKRYFRALMQHYFEGDVKMYEEDYEFKENLSRVLVFDNEKWFDNLIKLYKEYRLALKKENIERRWFPEELIMISSIFKQRIVFGEKKFNPVKLNATRLASIYINSSPLRRKFLNVASYLKNHTPKIGIIKINL
jgi:hypothetical protein